MVRTVRQQTERKRGEELARMSAASFAQVLSLLVLFAPLIFPSSPPDGWDGEEDEAGMMSERRCAALVLFLPGLSVPLLFPSLFIFVIYLYIIRYRYNKDNATN